MAVRIASWNSGSGERPGVGRVARAPAAEHEDVVALVVGGERVDAERIGEREQTILGGSDVLAAELGDHAWLYAMVEHTTAHAIAGLEQANLDARARQPLGGGQPGQPGPHHGHVHLAPAPPAPAGRGQLGRQECSRAGGRRPDEEVASARPYTGMTPCFFHGRSTLFVCAISSALMTVGRVSRGSMMSSIIALPAAM